MKKIIAIFCVILMLFSVCSVMLVACDDDSTEPTKPTTKPTKVTVTFDINYSGGVNPKAQTVEKNEAIVLPMVSRDDYDLDGWYTAALGGKLVGKAGDKYTASSDVTLYAHWTKRQPSAPLEENKTIVFYSSLGGSLRREPVDNAIQSFEEKYPGWTVQHEMVGSYDDLRDLIRTRLSNDTQPDIAFCYPEQVALYMQTGKVVDLSKFINSTETVNGQLVGYTAAEQADFVSAFWQEGLASSSFDGYQKCGYSDDTMFTLPLAKSTDVMYYNKTLLDNLGLQPATTWDELWQQCALIKEYDPSCVPLTVDSESNWFITMCEQNGWGYTSLQADNHYLFNNTNTEQWLVQLRNYYDQGYFTTGTISNAYGSSLLTGQFDRCIYSIGSCAGASLYENDYFEVGVARIPGSTGGNNRSIAQGPSLVMFSNNNYSNADEREMMTFLFMKELLDPSIMASYSIVSGYLPVRNSVYELAAYTQFLNGESIASRTMNVVLSVKDDMFTTPAFRGSMTAREQVGFALFKVLLTVTGGAPYEDVVRQALYQAYQECMFID